MATGVPFIPPDHEEFRAIAIKLHGNAKAIAARLNIIPHTLYAYFKKDPAAKQILDEIRGYNSFTDLDLAEYVNRYNMSQVTDNPSVAQRAAEFTLRFKGKDRGWVEAETKELSSQDDRIADTIDNAKVKAENALLKAAYDEIKRSLSEPETRTEHLPSEQTPEHMVRSGQIGEDLQQHLQTD